MWVSNFVKCDFTKDTKEQIKDKLLEVISRVKNE